MPAHPRVTVAQGLARGDPEGLPDQIKPGDLLADRMRDRQPGIYLEEGERAVAAEQELAGRRARVTRRPQDRGRRCPEPCVRIDVEERRRSLLHDLLMTPLQRAVPGRNHHDRAVPVCQALGFQVPRAVQIALGVALRPAARGLHDCEEVNSSRGGRTSSGSARREPSPARGRNTLRP